MASATTMSQPPPPPNPTRRPPPPPPPRKSTQGPSRKHGNGAPPPPPPRGQRPPPPGPTPSSSSKHGMKRKAPEDKLVASKAAKFDGKQTNHNINVQKGVKPPPPPGKSISTLRRGISIRKPVVLRDVSVFQKKYQVGQGTYGSVFVGADKETGEIVALKRINTEQEENGFPITALREVKILKALKNEHIVKLKEIVTSKEQNEIPKNVFMVFEYHEYDLTGILETSEIRFTQEHIKSWSMQLLKGVNFMHVNGIIHRDLKASNLLVNRNGTLVIADWGLARTYNKSMKQLTNGVVTLWYRPIELLLGCKQYSSKIDMWSVGCIIAEMFRRSGLLKGHDEASQLNLIFNTCGHPTQANWPKIREMCPLWKNFEPRRDEKLKPNMLNHVLNERLPYPAWMTSNAILLISKLLELNPDDRWCAQKAIKCDYFWEKPLVKTADKLPMKFGVESVHEWEARKKHELRRQAMKGTVKK